MLRLEFEFKLGNEIGYMNRILRDLKKMKYQT